MPRTKEQCLDLLTSSGLIAIMRAPNPQILSDISQALIAGGVLAIEVTMTTPKAIAAIESLAERFGDSAIVGVGTVLDAATCRDAISAGAQFVVSPHFDPAIVETTRRYGKVSIPGALTPTEILTAWSAGADLVKIFPSSTLGPAYIRDLLAPLPMLRLTPTGGVDAKNVGEWLKAGAVCVGAGASLVSKDAMAKGDWPAITASARAFMDAIRAARA
jgi:2-dehydro-3-deoxyphosphogluconate aldolase/(4S)-4-hydroxy-2-oxoglutarate aldolase